MTYQFPVDWSHEDSYEPLNRISVLPNQDEGLTGLVNNLPASDIEERFARSLDKYGVAYDFQVSYLAPRNMTGEYRLDFLVYIDGEMQPIAIDGEYAHKTESQRRKDIWKDDQFNNAKRGQFMPVKRITFEKLLDQDTADQTAQEVLWLG